MEEPQLDAPAMLAEIGRVSGMLNAEQLTPRTAIRESARLVACLGKLDDEEVSLRLGLLLRRLDAYAYAHITSDWVFMNLARVTSAILEQARAGGRDLRPARIDYILDTSAGSGNIVFLETGQRRVPHGPQNGEPGALEQAAEWFWCDGHVAMWVDVHLRQAGAEKVELSLLRSPGFIVPSGAIYHRREGYPPFHIPR